MTRKAATMILFYNLLLTGAAAACLPLTGLVVLLSDKRRKTVLRRLALTGLPDNFAVIDSVAGLRPVWVHALSVGEVVSVQPLLAALKNSIHPRPLVFSVSTKTGFELAAERLQASVDALFYFPFDLLFAVKRISRRINPALLVLVESDIWPNCLYEMAHRKVPVMLVNARLSNRSFPRYRRGFFFSEIIFSFFTKICAQTHDDARRLQLFMTNPGRVVTSGNLKFDQSYDPITAEDRETLRKMLNISADQRVFVAGSTHPGEELILKTAFTALGKKHPGLILVVVPRDPARARTVARIFSHGGGETTLFSDIRRGKIKKDPAVVVIDVIGILARLYALADLAFVGGSLVDFRGHNPLEPAAFSKPMLFGPFMGDFKEMAAMLLDAGGAVQVNGAGEMIREGDRILTDKTAAGIMGHHNFKVFWAHKGAVKKTLHEIMTVLEHSGTVYGNPG